MRREFFLSLRLLGALALLGTSLNAFALAPDQLTATSLKNARQLHQRGPVKAIGAAKLAAGLKNARSDSGVPGIDSLVNFTGTYRAQGVDASGNPKSQWTYAMVGRSPRSEEGVELRAPLIPVSVDLRDANGRVRVINGHRLYSNVKKYVRPTLQSPIFQNYWYSSSSEPTQYTDAIQRAEFWGSKLHADWHTLLEPEVGEPQIMQLSQDPACGKTNPDGSAGHCNYEFSLNADGTCCEFILVDIDVFVNAFFPTTTPVTADTPIGAAEINGDVTPRDLSSFLFPNTFLYFGDSSQCCVGGFHTVDFEPGDSSNNDLPRFYVLNYSSWISPGLFAEATDITALSHELSEIFNDPFVVFDGVTNLTPWWLSPNGICQDDLEVGDVVEGLPNSTFPITMHGFTYHPQNEALLSWFEFQSPSKAIGGAYSYPDPSVITALSAPQKANCAP